MLFTYHVTCENPKITRVIVCHPAMAGRNVLSDDGTGCLYPSVRQKSADSSRR
ncbi:MAG: hypothetical protein ACLRIL_10950 [Fusicatenibacter saccharivorans]